MLHIKRVLWMALMMLGALPHFIPCAYPMDQQKIILKNGDIVTGEIIFESEDLIKLKHPIFGELTIPKDQIKPVQKHHTEPATVKQKMPGPSGFGLLRGWQRHIAMGIKGEEGNKVRLDFNVALDLKKEDKEQRRLLSAVYYYESEHRYRDKNKGHISYVRDWLKPTSRWFYYSYSEYEFDSYRWWKQRLSFYGGPGYEFYKGDHFELRGRTGLGFVKTWGTDNEFNPEGLLGTEFSWKPNPIHQFSSEFITYWNLNDAGEFRTWWQLKWIISLDVLKGLNLELGFEHEYESVIDEQSGHNSHYDLTYFGRLGLDF